MSIFEMFSKCPTSLDLYVVYIVIILLGTIIRIKLNTIGEYLESLEKQLKSIKEQLEKLEKSKEGLQDSSHFRNTGDDFFLYLYSPDKIIT